MIRRFIFIGLLAFVIFFVELILFNFFGRWFKPNLLLLFVIFMSLYLGIRYSIVTALFAGFIKDCFSVSLFGLNIFSFVACAYLTVFIRRYHFAAASSSRIVTIFWISVANVLLHYIINVMFLSANFKEMFIFILCPEVLATLFVSGYFFKKLKILASKFSL